jgi:hypothetical protein
MRVGVAAQGEVLICVSQAEGNFGRVCVGGGKRC